MRQSTVKITPTPITAALAGLFSALVLLVVWSRFGGIAGAGNVGLIVVFLLAVALPAHAFVVGFVRGHAPAPGTLDTALLKRIVAWLAAAIATLLIAEVLRGQ